MEEESLIPPAPFGKGVAKLGDTSNKIINSQRRRYLPYEIYLKEYARKLRNNMTMAERKLWREILRKDQMEGLRFLRQKPLGVYIADFYCSKLLLVIEVDGSSHFTLEGLEYDLIRTAALENLEIKVIRYTNQEVLNNLEGVFEDLKKQIEARKKELETKKINELFDMN